MSQAPATTVGTPQAAPALAPAAPQTSTSIPKTSGELQGLIAKRSELNDQLENLTDRRQELFEQRERMGREEGREHDARIQVLDQRSAQIEREVLQADDAIAQAYANGVTLGDAARTATTSQAAQLSRDLRNGVEDSVAGTISGWFFGMLAAFLVWKGIRRWIFKKKPAPAVPAMPDQSPRLDQLQQSVDVIALEVERISEAQRFVAKMLNEKIPALGAGEAQPVSTRSREASPERR